MTRRMLRRGKANTLLVISILVSSALFQSEIGGPGTIYNSIVIVLAVLLLLRNGKFEGALVFAFGLPVAILALSVAMNVATLHPGGYRSAVATAIGYLLCFSNRHREALASVVVEGLASDAENHIVDLHNSIGGRFLAHMRDKNLATGGSSSALQTVKVAGWLGVDPAP